MVFSLNCIFNSKFYFICFLQFYCTKRPKNLFTVKIANNICPRDSAFIFFNHKNFLRPIWNIAFCKKFFYFDILTGSPTLNFRIFFIIIYNKLNICAGPYINRVHFDCAMICIVLFIDYIN